MSYKILEILSYYRIKRYLKDLFLKRKLMREDARNKSIILKHILSLSGTLLHSNGDNTDIIVSLTSYGKRVTDTLPFTLYSLLCQTVMPNRIVVWLDNDNWNDENIPEILKNIQSHGVEFYYTKDIRSYKKLIPALQRFPNNVIITVDDDMHYNEHIIEWLVNEYNKSDKMTVIGATGCIPTYKNNSYLPTTQWNMNARYDMQNEELSLIGFGGILYPPNIFDDEILKEQLFMALAPTADDLWFWIMEKRQGIKISLIPQAGWGLHTAVNRIDVWFPNREGSLFYINSIHGKNDEQLKKLLDYYNVTP